MPVFAVFFSFWPYTVLVIASGYLYSTILKHWYIDKERKKNYRHTVCQLEYSENFQIWNKFKKIFKARLPAYAGQKNV